MRQPQTIRIDLYRKECFLVVTRNGQDGYRSTSKDHETDMFVPPNYRIHAAPRTMTMLNPYISITGNPVGTGTQSKKHPKQWKTIHCV